ncbi:DNA-processing protein DprA [Pedobacter gandavensis]|uniref:DNA-processing protein DprA n=1 Tax=Pedobacter gandavensis TaxID=2679963 RepID=UPI00247AE403|nr:DNA-processing protein DprA [Pedobacter gandavensis]WGQ08847.1 DNA-processing protein DprA [Pedobacter gandavensis]
MSLIYKIALSMIQNVGHVTAKHLLTHFITPEAVFKADKKALLRVPGVGLITAEHILGKNAILKAKEQLKFIEKYQVKVLFYTDDDYPSRLRNCEDAPILLYYRGTANLNHPRIISIVGTRMATSYGKMLCKQLAEVLAPYDVLIVSGLAYGIDICAHQESLAHGIPTVGVLAHGLDRMYPQVHGPAAQKMVLNGGLLTEFPPYTNPDKENFPKRNRIIAGISDVTIVVEAASKGGALITADLANSYHRDVYAFPGRTTDIYSEGCNFLIKTNRAGLMSHAKDLPYFLGWDESTVKAVLPTELPADLSEIEVQILKVLKVSDMELDALTHQIGLPQSKLLLHLLTLEIEGLLTSLPGKRYRLN